MLKISAAIAALCISLAATGASAQTRLPEVIQSAAEARSGVFDGREKSPWALEQYGSDAGKGCMLYHVTQKEMMIVVGPDAKGIVTDSPNEAAVLLFGPNIPLPAGGEMRHQQVTVRINGFPMRSVRAILLPGITPDSKSGGILLYSPTLEEGLMLMRDEQSLGIDIDGKSVFSTSWTGAAAQVSKLRACVAGKPA